MSCTSTTIILTNEIKNSKTTKEHRCPVCHDIVDLSLDLMNYHWFKHYDIDRMGDDDYYGRKIRTCPKAACRPKCSVCKGNLTRYIQFKDNDEYICEPCFLLEIDVEFDESIDYDSEYALRTN